MIQLSFRDDSSLTPELGFTATKKIGNAVIRNRCRRRLRALCDQVVGQFALQGVQMVIIARPELENYEFAKLVKDLRWALRRLNVPSTGEENVDTSAIIPREQAV